jgi:hypothetical protein
VAQVVESLPNKCEALRSNPSTAKKQKRKTLVPSTYVSKIFQGRCKFVEMESMEIPNWGEKRFHPLRKS